MTRYIRTAASVLCGLLIASNSAIADDGDEFAAFRGYDEASTYSVSYEDLSLLLSKAVFDTGRSTRKLAEEPPDITGTRMKSKVNRLTQGEGNRFLYESFRDNEDGKNYMRAIQRSLGPAVADTRYDPFPSAIQGNQNEWLQKTIQLTPRSAAVSSSDRCRRSTT